MRLVPMIEDPAAVLDARRIVAATPRVCALITGGEDLATSLGAEPTPEVLHFPKLMVHFAAKAAGVLSLGLMRTVADYDDLMAMEKSAREARMYGFDGASCVHPSVVPILNRAFSPSEEELDRARRLIAAYEQAEARGPRRLRLRRQDGRRAGGAARPRARCEGVRRPAGAPRPFTLHAVIAGPVPATPIIRHGRAMLSGVAGTSPAMTHIKTMCETMRQSLRYRSSSGISKSCQPGTSATS